MPFVNISSVIPTNLRDVKSTGVLLPVSERDDLILAAVFKQQVIAVVLSPGDTQFRSFVVNAEQSRVGMFIEDVRFEVDYDTVVDRYKGDVKTGYLQIGAGCGQILGAMNNQGLLERVPIPFLSIDGSEDGPETAFKSWRIVHMVGDERVVLFEHGKRASLVYA